MNSKQFFQMVVNVAIENDPSPMVTDMADVGQFFSFVNTQGTLRYISLNDEVMNTVFEKVTGQPTYDQSSFLVPEDESQDVKFARPGDSSLTEGNYDTVLDVLEIIVDEKDHSSFLITAGGDTLLNTGGFVMDEAEDHLVFKYKGSAIRLRF